MKSTLSQLLSVLLLISLLASCNSYQRVLKSDDYDFKREKAKEYYNKGDYFKAIPIFEELIRIGKGRENVEELYYFYAYSHYGQSDYELAAYFFGEFVKNYPRSIRAEEAQFMVAKCYHQQSPKVTLEQTSTERALEYYQLFVNTYPQSERVEEANGFMDELRDKLEDKSYISAKLYFDMRQYRAAATAFKNMLIQFPDTERREEIQYLVTKSYYLLASNSIKSKLKERYEATVENYEALIDNYPESNYLKEAEKFYADALDALEQLKKENIQ